jgi:hypothetical protein
MPLLNGIGITGISQDQPALVEGQLASWANYEADTYAVSLLSQVTEIVYSGVSPGNGVYTASITLPDGSIVTASTAALVSPGLDDIANAVAAALQTLADEGALHGYVASAVSDATDTVTITFGAQYAGISFSVSAGVQSGTTAAVANTTDAGSSPSTGMPMGRAVVRVNDDLEVDGRTLRMRLPQSGDAETAIVGVLLRDMSQPNQGSISPSATSNVQPGTLGSVAHFADVAVVNARGTAAPGGTVYVQIIANGGVSPGQFAASADGGNSVTLGAARAKWLTNTSAGQVGIVRVHMIG